MFCSMDVLILFESFPDSGRRELHDEFNEKMLVRRKYTKNRVSGDLIERMKVLPERGV